MSRHRSTGFIGTADINEHTFDAEWRVCEASRYYNTPYLYKDNGFKDKDKARELVDIYQNHFLQRAL